MSRRIEIEIDAFIIDDEIMITASIGNLRESDREQKHTIKTQKKEDSCGIKSYKVFNNKVVIVNFDDGTTEKAICSNDDTFSVEAGLNVCILKHLLGGSGAYNHMIQRVVKQHDKEEKEEKRNKLESGNKKNADERKRKKKADKRKERRIREFTEAIMRANCVKDHL